MGLTRAERAMSREERFWSRVDKSGEHWIWQGSTDSDGYGKVRFWPDGGEHDGRAPMSRAHRFAWTYEWGPIPDDTWVLHHCDISGCVRPDCLYLGDHQDNMDDLVDRNRGYRAQNTHCKRGHEFTPENTIIRSNGTRRCRACHNLRRREYRAERN